MSETKLKRDKIKYIRDRAKSHYPKGTECEICGETENLDFHHYYSMTEMLEKWLRMKRKEDSAFYSDENIEAWRDEFIEEHHEKVFDLTVTLCHKHHVQLHGIYGKRPPLSTSPKQIRWVARQREKHGLVQ